MCRRIYLRKCFPILLQRGADRRGQHGHQHGAGPSERSRPSQPPPYFRTLEGLVIGFFAGFSNASAVLVGKAVGAGELDEAYGTARRLVYLCGGFIFLGVPYAGTGP